MTNKDYLEVLKKVRTDYITAQMHTMSAFKKIDCNGKIVVTVWEMFSENLIEYNKKIEYYSTLKPSALCKYDYVEKSDYDDLPFL